MINDPIESLSIAESGKGIWIKDGLPPLVNDVLAEVPRDPYTFVVNQLKFLDSGGREIDTKEGVRVVLGHGIYDKKEHALKFLNDQKVTETVLTYNKDQPDDPIQMVVACSGDQVPINADDPNKNPDDNVYAGPFNFDQGVAYSISTDLDVTMIKEEDNTVNMTVRQKNPDGGFMFIENIKDTESQITIT